MLVRQVRPHTPHIGCRITVRAQVITQVGIVGRLPVMIHVAHHEPQFRKGIQWLGILQLSLVAIGHNVFRPIGQRIAVVIIPQDTAGAAFIHRLAPQHQLVVTPKRVVNIQAEAHIVQARLNPVGNTVGLAYSASHLPFAGRINHIGRITLGVKLQAYISLLVPHGRGQSIAVGVERTHLHIHGGFRHVRWFLGDDVDGTGHGTAAIQRRASPLDDLNLPDVRGSHLLQPIHPGQTRIQGLAIDHDLRMFSPKPLHTDHGEVAGLTLIFHPHTWSTFQRLE